jgi:hypothetical protein
MSDGHARRSQTNVVVARHRMDRELIEREKKIGLIFSSLNEKNPNELPPVTTWCRMGFMTPRQNLQKINQLE